MTENVLIIGSGALACLFAARLSEGGQPVTLTGTWVAGVDAIRHKGIGWLEGETIRYIPVHVLETPDLSRKFGSAILLTKAYQTTEALNRVRPYLAENCPVLSLQNGLTPRRQMLSLLGEARAISGTTTCAAEQIGPGVIRYNGGSTVILGEHPDVELYRQLLMAGSFDVTVSGDIQQMIWEKAVINSAANPLGAILRMKNGEMVNAPEVMELMDNLITEACDVAAADGCQLQPAVLQQRMREILENTASNRCSMLQDVMNNRRTEINDINGSILDIAETHHVSTPVQRTITQLVRSIRREEH